MRAPHGERAGCGLKTLQCLIDPRNVPHTGLGAGRADYYGTLPNLAARLSTLANPGQILVESGAAAAPSASRKGSKHHREVRTSLPRRRSPPDLPMTQAHPSAACEAGLCSSCWGDLPKTPRLECAPLGLTHSALHPRP